MFVINSVAGSFAFGFCCYLILLLVVRLFAILLIVYSGWLFAWECLLFSCLRCSTLTLLVEVFIDCLLCVAVML